MNTFCHSCASLFQEATIESLFVSISLFSASFRLVFIICIIWKCPWYGNMVYHTIYIIYQNYFQYSVHTQYTLSIHSVHTQYTLGTLSTHSAQYTVNTQSVHTQYTQSTHTVHTQYTHTHSTHTQYTHRVHTHRVHTQYTHCGVMVIKSVNDVIVFAWLPGSRISADPDSRSKKQRTAHKQEQKVNSWNYSRYVDQASLTYILTTCHPASLAEEVTWAPLPPAFENCTSAINRTKTVCYNGVHTHTSHLSPSTCTDHVRVYIYIYVCVFVCL